MKNRWRALKRKDDSMDMYAVGFCTHTVCKVVLNGRTTFEAWRCEDPAVQLGMFRGDKAFDEAKLCVENDARALRIIEPAKEQAA